MFMFTRTIGAAATCFLFLVSVASAHYLWVTIDEQASVHGTANIYFEGGPAVGDGHYLDRFVKRGKTWIRTVDAPQPKELTVEDKRREPKKRWLAAKLPQSAPRSIDSYGKFGVYRYGKTDVLLNYYGRHIQVNDHDQLHELARAEQMALDIVPHDAEGALELKVIWQGKPAAKCKVYIRGPQGFKANIDTNDEGVAAVKIGKPGRYQFRTHVEQKQEGEFDGESYQLIRHHATLLMTLPLNDEAEQQ